MAGVNGSFDQGRQFHGRGRGIEATKPAWMTAGGSGKTDTSVSSKVESRGWGAKNESAASSDNTSSWGGSRTGTSSATASSWGKKSATQEGGGWGKKNSSVAIGDGSSWGEIEARASSSSSSWGGKRKSTSSSSSSSTRESGVSSWGRSAPSRETSSQMPGVNGSERAFHGRGRGREATKPAWMTASESNTSKRSSARGGEASAEGSSLWGGSRAEASTSSSTSGAKREATSSTTTTTTQEKGGWGKKDESVAGVGDLSWGGSSGAKTSSSSWGKRKTASSMTTQESSGWGRKVARDDKSGATSSWGKSEPPSRGSGGWGRENDRAASRGESRNGTSSSSSWGKDDNGKRPWGESSTSRSQDPDKYDSVRESFKRRGWSANQRSSTENRNRIKGTVVKWIPGEFGFITTDDDGDDLFFGESALSYDDIDKIQVGSKVLCEKYFRESKRKWAAKNVVLLTMGEQHERDPRRREYDSAPRRQERDSRHREYDSAPRREQRDPRHRVHDPAPYHEETFDDRAAPPYHEYNSRTASLHEQRKQTTSPVYDPISRRNQEKRSIKGILDVPSELHHAKTFIAKVHFRHVAGKGSLFSVPLSIYPGALTLHAERRVNHATLKRLIPAVNDRVIFTVDAAAENGEGRLKTLSATCRKPEKWRTLLVSFGNESQTLYFIPNGTFARGMLKETLHGVDFNGKLGHFLVLAHA